MTTQTHRLKLPILSFFSVFRVCNLSRTRPVLELVKGIRYGSKKRNEPIFTLGSGLWSLRLFMQNKPKILLFQSKIEHPKSKITKRTQIFLWIPASCRYTKNTKQSQS
jgi:hypothetical protein